MSHNYCHLTGKQMFHTRTDALRAAQRMKEKREGEPSVYQCSACNAYHITHYTYEHSKATREAQDRHGLTLRKKRHPKDMKIFIDTEYEESGLGIDIVKNKNGERRVRLSMLDAADRPATYLDYDQASELIEALKIQTAKL